MPYHIQPLALELFGAQLAPVPCVVAELRWHLEHDRVIDGSTLVALRSATFSEPEIGGELGAADSNDSGRKDALPHGCGLQTD